MVDCPLLVVSWLFVLVHRHNPRPCLLGMVGLVDHLDFALRHYGDLASSLDSCWDFDKRVVSFHFLKLGAHLLHFLLWVSPQNRVVKANGWAGREAIGS